MKKKITRVLALVSAMVAAMAQTVLANDTPSVAQMMTTAFQTIVVDLMATIVGIMPVALSILGMTMAVAFSIKWFKKLAGIGG